MSKDDFLTLDVEELKRRWRVLINSLRQPKNLFMKDGQLIAGENLSRGDLVYLQSSEQTPTEG